ncbi:MAG: response regulator transcription factor [Terriglobales bacterium]
MSTKSVSVIIADDHSIVCDGIALLLQSQPGMIVVGQCGDGVTAIAMVNTLRPDVALVDVEMPGMDGLEAVRMIREENQTTRLIVLSANSDQNTVREALGSGADGYVVKDGPHRHLLDAIKHTLEGGIYVSPSLGSMRLFERPRRDSRPGDPIYQLSGRERQVFSFYVNGRKSGEIAVLLSISNKTVDTYRANIMRKLGVTSLAGLVKFALHNNLTSKDNAG